MLLIEAIARARVADREREIAARIRRRALLGPRNGRGTRSDGSLAARFPRTADAAR